MPSWWLKAYLLPSGLVHCVGVRGFQPACSRVAMVASMGPLMHIHLDLADWSRLSLLLQLVVTILLSFRSMRWYMAIQDWTCSYGMRTLGSAEALVTLLFRKAHWIVEVAQAPAPIMPVAVAMFRLHPFVAVGDIPTAVWPYEWAGWTPVSASLLALWLSLARVAVLRALLRACLMRAACFWVARLADELVSNADVHPCRVS